jgi:hypothetical protein
VRAGRGPRRQPRRLRPSTTTPSSSSSATLSPPTEKAARTTVCMFGSLKPSDRSSVLRSFATLRSRPQRKPVRFTSYAATTRMRRSRSNLLHSAHGSAYAAGPLHSLPPHTRKVGSALRTGFARPHVRHAVRSSFSSGMNANQPDRPGLARNADALKTLMPLGNNRHRPLLSRTLTTESVGRGFEPCRPRWKRLSSTLENAGLVGSQKKAA